MWNLKQHSYEEIREMVVDILLKRVSVEYEPNQWTSLTSGVAEVFAKRANSQERRLHPYDAELVRDVFWDLFRHGFIDQIVPRSELRERLSVMLHYLSARPVPNVALDAATSSNGQSPHEGAGSSTDMEAIRG